MGGAAAMEPPSVSMSFANNFWGKDDAGVGPMLDRMHAAKVTNDELKNFYAARAAIEEEYSRKLLNLSRKQLGSCETGTLRLSCDVIRAEVESMGKSHQSIAHQMKTELEEPLAAFAGGMKERRKIVQNGIEKLLKLKMQQTATVNKARDRYEQDCLKIKGFLAQAHMVMGHEERKNKAKLEKTQINLTTTSAEYEAAVKVLEETTGRWNRDWKAACDKFQDLEEERIDYTKSSLWNFANIASTVCVSDDASCEKMRLSLEDCDVEKDIFGFIKESGTGQEIPDPPKFINFCRGDAETSSQVSEDENYSVAQFARTLNPAYRASSPAPSTFSSHHDPKNPLARELGIPQNTAPITQNEVNARPRPSADRSRKSVDSFRQSVDKPRQSIDSFRQSVDKPRQSTDSFRQSVDMSRHSIDMSRQPVELPPPQAEPPRQYEQHRQYAEEPQQYMEEARYYPEEPQQYMEEPRQYVEPPQQYVEPPQQYMEPPQQYMEEPRQYVEPPQQQAEPLRQHVEQPRKSVEQMRQHIEQPRQQVQPLRQHVEPQQQRIEPLRQHTEPPRQHVEPLRQQPEPRRQRIEPSRQQSEPQRQPVEPEPVQPVQPPQATRAIQPDPRLVQAQQEARQQYQQSEVPHNDYPADGMTQFCRIGPPSDRSSIPSPVRPASRDSQSEYSNPTSFSSIEAPSPATPSKPVPQEMPPSPAEPTPPEEGSVAKKRGFFNSPFARRKSKHEIEPPPLASSNRNTWTPPSRRNTQENVSPVRNTPSPTKSVATPTKLNATPAKLNTSPTKLNATPAKLNTSPTKFSATPAKLNTSPTKFNATPAKLNTSPTKTYPSPARHFIGRTRAIESAPHSPSPEPDAADPRANFQLNVGNNVFDVASPDKKQSEEQAEQQEELDPIAQALEELRGVTKQASVRQTVDDRKQASVRQTADRYHGLATPAPPATPAVGSKLAGSAPTPLSNVALNAAKRGTPPPSYETPPMSRLGAPKPAHTSRAMQKTTQMYVNQKANMFNTTEPARASSRSPTKQEAPRTASPAPARAASPSPRPSPLTTQQASPQNSYRMAQPASPSTYQPVQRQAPSPSTYRPAQQQAQSPSTFQTAQRQQPPAAQPVQRQQPPAAQPVQRQQPPAAQPVQRQQPRAAQSSPRPQSVVQPAPKPVAQPVTQPAAQPAPRAQPQVSRPASRQQQQAPQPSRPASRQQQQPPQASPAASFSRTASPNPYAPSNVGGRPRAQTATSTAQAYGTPVGRNSYSSTRGPSPSVNTTPRTASPLPPQQPPQQQQPPQPSQPQQPQQPPQPAFAQSQSRPQSRAAPLSRTASPNPQFRQSNDRPPSSRGSDRTVAPSIAGSVRGDGSVYGGSQFGGSVRGRPPSARPQSSYMSSAGSEFGFDAGSGSSVRAESRTRSKSLAEPKNYNSQGRLILNYSRAMYSYAAQIPEELGFQKGDILAVLRLQDDGWWEAEAVGKQGRPGLVPSNYLQPC
ncbi:SH3 domain-containing protein [Pyrenophora tritici-repentis]|nr:SH3 domain-containing protein [Pyrenophora tritici-repentis]